MAEVVYWGMPPLPRVLEKLAGLDANQLAVLQEEISSSAAYDHSLNRSTALAARLGGGLETADVVQLLTALEFLHDRCRDWEEAGKNAADALRELFQTTGIAKTLGEDPEQSVARLLRLVSRHAELERRKKLSWLRTGLLDTAVGFASFLDLRPRFSSDRSTIEEFVPVVICRIAVERELGEDDALVFQLNRDGIRKLRTLVKEIDAKLSALANDPQLAARMSQGDQNE